MNRSELITTLRRTHENFLTLIEDLDEDTLTQVEHWSGWTIKDVVIHLTLWESELVKLLWQVEQGLKPSTLHFSEETVDQINARWHEEHTGRSWDRAYDDFIGIRSQTIRRLQGFSEKALTDPNHFPWSQGRPLWQWIAESSYTHEKEHSGQIQVLIQDGKLSSDRSNA